MGWRQVASGFMLLACVATITTSYSVIAVPIAAEFKPSRAVMGLAMTVISGGSAILAPFLGALMDRTSVKRLMLIGVVFLAAGYATLTFVRSFNEVLLVYALLIAPANVLIGPVAITVLLSRWFVARRGAALGIAIAGVAMGGVLFPPMIQALLNAFPWREAMRLFALTIFALTALAAGFVVDRPAAKGLHPDGADAEPVKRAGAGPALSVREILTDPAFWLIVAMVAVVTSGMKGMVTNLAPLAMDEGIPPSRAAWLVSVYASMGFLAKLSFAAVADRINLRYLAVTSLLGFGTGMLVLTQAQLGFWLIAGGVGLVGLFGGMMVPLESMLGARVFGRDAVGRAVGLLSMVLLVALMSTPPLFGLIFDLTGTYAGIFYTFGGLAVVMTLVVPSVRMQARDAPGPNDIPEPAAEAVATTG
jgi:MFS family permease